MRNAANIRLARLVFKMDVVGAKIQVPGSLRDAWKEAEVDLARAIGAKLERGVFRPVRSEIAKADFLSLLLISMPILFPTSN